MYRLYKKNELYFALVWIIGYVILVSLADNLSTYLHISKIITAPLCVVFTLLLLIFIKKYKLLEKYGLCSFKGDLKKYFFFIPLVLIASVNLWNGVNMNFSIFETVLFIISMLCVGFIEEIIFRGFFFKALCKDNIKLAIFISSITFGIGHIVNLLNGKDLVSTLLQICYAIALGFLFTIIFHKGKSLLPCIITHGIINSSNAFSNTNFTFTYEVITSVILCIVSVTYALWILWISKKTGEIKIDENKDLQ